MGFLTDEKIKKLDLTNSSPKEIIEVGELINKDLVSAGLTPMTDEEIAKIGTDKTKLERYNRAKKFYDLNKKVIEHSKYELKNNRVFERSIGFMVDLNESLDSEKNKKIIQNINTVESQRKYIRKIYDFVKDIPDEEFLAIDFDEKINLLSKDFQMISQVFIMDNLVSGALGDDVLSVLSKEELAELRERVPVFEFAGEAIGAVLVAGDKRNLIFPDLKEEELTALAAEYDKKSMVETQKFILDSVLEKKREERKKFREIKEAFKKYGLLDKSYGYIVFDENGDEVANKVSAMEGLSLGTLKKVQIVKYDLNDPKKKPVSPAIAVYASDFLPENANRLAVKNALTEHEFGNDARGKLMRAYVYNKVFDEKTDFFKEKDPDKAVQGLKNLIKNVDDGKDMTFNTFEAMPEEVRDEIVLATEKNPSETRIYDYIGEWKALNERLKETIYPGSNIIDAYFNPVMDISKFQQNVGKKDQGKEIIAARTDASKINIDVPKGLTEDEVACLVSCTFRNPEYMAKAYKKSLGSKGSTLPAGFPFDRGGAVDYEENFATGDERANMHTCVLFLKDARNDAIRILEEYKKGDYKKIADELKKGFDLYLGDSKNFKERDRKIARYTARRALDIIDFIEKHEEIGKEVKFSDEDLKWIKYLRNEEKIISRQNDLKTETVKELMIRKARKNNLFPPTDDPELLSKVEELNAINEIWAALSESNVEKREIEEIKYGYAKDQKMAEREMFDIEFLISENPEILIRETKKFLSDNRDKQTQYNKVKNAAEGISFVKGPYDRVFKATSIIFEKEKEIIKKMMTDAIIHANELKNKNLAEKQIKGMKSLKAYNYSLPDNPTKKDLEDIILAYQEFVDYYKKNAFFIPIEGDTLYHSEDENMVAVGSNFLNSLKDYYEYSKFITSTKEKIVMHEKAKAKDAKEKNIRNIFGDDGLAEIKEKAFEKVTSEAQKLDDSVLEFDEEDLIFGMPSGEKAQSMFLRNMEDLKKYIPAGELDEYSLAIKVADALREGDRINYRIFDVIEASLEKKCEELNKKLLDDDSADTIERLQILNNTLNSVQAVRNVTSLIPDIANNNAYVDLYDSAAEKRKAIDISESDLAFEAGQALEKIADSIKNEAMGNKTEGFESITSSDILTVAIYERVKAGDKALENEININGLAAAIERLSSTDRFRNNINTVNIKTLGDMLAGKRGLEIMLTEDIAPEENPFKPVEAKPQPALSSDFFDFLDIEKMTLEEKMCVMHLVNEDLVKAKCKPLTEEEMLQIVNDKEAMDDYVLFRETTEKIDRIENYSLKEGKYDRDHLYPLSRSLRYMVDLNLPVTSDRNMKIINEALTLEGAQKRVREVFEFAKSIPEEDTVQVDNKGKLEFYNRNISMMKQIFEMDHVIADLTAKGENRTGLTDLELAAFKDKLQMLQNSSYDEMMIRAKGGKPAIFFAKFDSNRVIGLEKLYSSHKDKKLKVYCSQIEGNRAVSVRKYEKELKEDFLAYDLFDSSKGYLCTGDGGKVYKNKAAAFDDLAYGKTKKVTISKYDYSDPNKTPLGPAVVIDTDDYLPKNAARRAVKIAIRNLEFGEERREQLIKAFLNNSLFGGNAIMDKILQNKDPEAAIVKFDEYVEKIREGKDVQFNKFDLLSDELKDVIIERIKHNQADKMSAKIAEGFFEYNTTINNYENVGKRQIEYYFAPEMTFENSFKPYTSGEEQITAGLDQAVDQAMDITIEVPQGLTEREVSNLIMGRFRTPDKMIKSYEVSLNMPGSTLPRDTDFEDFGANNFEENFMGNDERANLYTSLYSLPAARTEAKKLVEEFRKGNYEAVAKAFKEEFDLYLGDNRRYSHIKDCQSLFTAHRVIEAYETLQNNEKLKGKIQFTEEEKKWVEYIKLRIKTYGDVLKLKKELMDYTSLKAVKDDNTDPKADNVLRDKYLEYTVKREFLFQNGNLNYINASYTDSRYNRNEASQKKSNRDMNQFERMVIGNGDRFFKTFENEVKKRVLGSQNFTGLKTYRDFFESIRDSHKSAVGEGMYLPYEVNTIFAETMKLSLDRIEREKPALRDKIKAARVMPALTKKLPEHPSKAELEEKREQLEALYKFIDTNSIELDTFKGFEADPRMAVNTLIYKVKQAEPSIQFMLDLETGIKNANINKDFESFRNTIKGDDINSREVTFRQEELVFGRPALQTLRNRIVEVSDAMLENAAVYDKADYLSFSFAKETLKSGADLTKKMTESVIKELEKVQEKLLKQMDDDDTASMKQYSDINRVISAYEAYLDSQKIQPAHRTLESPLARAYEKASERIETISKMDSDSKEMDKLNQMAIDSLEKIKECLYNEATGNRKEGIASINSKDLAILAVHDLIRENPLSPQVEKIETISAEAYINKVSEHDALKNNAKRITAKSLETMIENGAGFTDVLVGEKKVKGDDPQLSHVVIQNNKNLVL